MKLRDLAHRLDCRLEGDGDIDITRVASLDKAGPGDISFLANVHYTTAMRQTAASAVILGEQAPAAPCAMLRTPHPYLAFANAMTVLTCEARPAPGIHPLSSIAPDAAVGEGVAISAFVFVGSGARIGRGTIIYPGVYVGDGVTIGEDCLIHAHVSIRERSVIGHRVILQNGAVIGSDGFGFAPRPDGSYQKIPQAAIVVIEDDVEIGANTTIDKPALGETRIKAGAKLDNLVQVAHGVSIGRNTVLSAQVGVAGSSTVGDQVVLAGQVGVADHVEVGRGSRATAQTGIPSSLPAESFVSGTPAVDNRDWLKASAVFRSLPDLRRTVRDLQRRIAALEEQLVQARTGDEPKRD